MKAEPSRIKKRMQEIRFSPAVNYDDALWRAAAEYAVDSSYWDIFGRQHHASRETLQAILGSLGVDVERFETIEAARRARFTTEARAGVSGTTVVSENARQVLLYVGAGRSGSLCYTIELEGQGRLTGSLELSQLSQHVELIEGDARWIGYSLQLPAELPLGYHELEFTVGGLPAGRTHLIVCPDRTWLPARLEQGGKAAGFNVALYGLRSARNWGCGDFTDLQRLIEWAAHDVGFSFIGLNPLHAIGNRTPYNTSPYLPLSTYYKNLIYIDLEAVPEFASSACAAALAGSPKVRDEVARLRASEFVQYSDVDHLKRRFLKVLYREFRRGKDAARRQRFKAYCETEGDLLSSFAVYCALEEAMRKQDRSRWTWQDWPAPYRDSESETVAEFARTHVRSIEFYKYIQFVIEEQLATAQEHARQEGMSIGLYHDLAVATDTFGSDLWAHPHHYVNGCRMGAPPDDFSPEGQDWGFPPPDKETHRAEGYRLFRESIRKIVRHGGALRIDHVMRLYRLFWVPRDMSPAAGAYVRDYAADLMHVLALESVRSQNIIVGEDLGTVTDEMRALFTRFGILSYRLFPFEKNYQTGEYRNSFEYPRQALVSSTTHDLSTLAGFWQGRDIEARREAGLADEASHQAQSNDRRRERQRMLDTLHSENLLPASYTRDAADLHALDGELHGATVAFLARVPSLLLLLNQEDFTKETEQQNLPGSTTQYPNWQRKMRAAVEDLTSDSWRPYSQMFHDRLQASGRLERLQPA